MKYIRTVSNPAEIRIKHLPITNQQHHRPSHKQILLTGMSVVMMKISET
jgi:hypothetical protein